MRSSPSLSPHIPFPFFSPSAFFWRGEAARLRQACGQGHRSQACRRRSPAHDAGPAGPGGHYQPTLRLLTTSGRHRDLRDESQSEGVRRGGNSPEHEAPTPRYSISSTSWTVCPLVIRYYLPLACRAHAGRPPSPSKVVVVGGQIVSSRAHFADVLVMVLPCACRQAVHACLPGPTNAAVSSSASWSGLQHSSVRPLPVNSRYLY